MDHRPRDRMSPYAFFVQACWAELRRRHPHTIVSLSEFSRQSCERWRSSTARERAQFEDLSIGDQYRYEREMKCYIPATRKTKKKKERDPDKPKRPTSSFFLFSAEHCAQMRADFPDVSMAVTSKMLGKKWAEQTPDNRKPYEEKALQLKETYEMDAAVYRAKVKVGKKVPARQDFLQKRKHQRRKH